MGFSVERQGFITVPQLFNAVITDMLANGFTLKFPVTHNSADEVVTLEASATVDPLAATQPWRVQFQATSDFIGNMVVATPLQLPNDGTAALDYKIVGDTLPQDVTGILGTKHFLALGTVNSAVNRFIDRTVRIPDLATAASFPLSYRLSISDRGFTLFVWEEASDTDGDKFSWVNVQRPVDHVTGEAVVTGKCPVFCVYSLANSIRKFVVREIDVLRPTYSVSATSDTADSAAIINSVQQVAISEDNKYIVTFPNHLNTQRYAYTYELDQIAYTSADVISQAAQVPIRPYGEAVDRIYRAMNANGINNSGMRLLMLESGGGV